MRFFSTFTGIGGFELGIGPEHECVGYSEIDKYAVQIYQSHFPKHKNYGDITKIDAAALPDFDLLVGGFPCQAFSIAGKRAGFADTRGTLFFDLARILRAKRPRLFLFENVKGLLSHDGGRTFRTIIATIAELGYDAQWQVLNSKNHGVPQNRERVFIVGHLRGSPRPQVFPLEHAHGAHTAPRAHGQKVRDIAQTLTARQYANWGGNFIEAQGVNRPSRGTEVRKDGLAATLKSGQSGSQRPTIAYTLKARADSGIDAKHPQTLILEGGAVSRFPNRQKEGTQSQRRETPSTSPSWVARRAGAAWARRSPKRSTQACNSTRWTACGSVDSLRSNANAYRAFQTAGRRESATRSGTRHWVMP